MVLSQQQTVQWCVSECPRPSLDVRGREEDLSVEPPWSEEGGVKDIRSVGPSQDHHIGGRCEAIHLHQELVERVLSLVVTSEPSLPAPLPTDRIDLVNEYDTRGILDRGESNM